jgi:multiple sugar transport system permease protein
MAGYAFAKVRFKGSKFLFFLILMAMMIPYQVTQVPLYILFVNKFKMTNTFTALILPGCVTSYNIFLSKQFFSGIPTSLIENAKVEGATQFRIFRSIILPLSKTVLAVMAINTFMGNWNTFFWPFLVTSKESMYTIQVGLKTFKFANGTLLSPMMAGATISALPMFVLFFSLQKYFLEGVTIGAVKG